MPYAHDSPMSDRIRVELIEAEVEQVFELVDLAEEEFFLRHDESSALILADAERVFSDIERRLGQVGPAEATPFAGLVGEMRRAIDGVRSHSA